MQTVSRPKTASARLSERLRAQQLPASGNACVADALEPGDLEAIEAEVAFHVGRMLDALVIEPDHNTEDTPGRVAKMLVREVFAGRYQPRPELTDFPNAGQLDQVYTVGPITIRSACAHHLVPITGEAWIGVIPGARIIGLSKFHRITDWIMARPQIQEEATVQLADELEAAIRPLALGVVVRARHLCCGWRGVRDANSLMTTSVVRGLFREDATARAEFFDLIKAQGFS